MTEGTGCTNETQEGVDRANGMLGTHALAAARSSLPMALLHPEGWRFIHANSPFRRLFGLASEPSHRNSLEVLADPDARKRRSLGCP
jgi:hypothetical protein